ncbi:tyrosinase family protein [Caldimonas brevitalea]|uniref:Tyrosinase n=1 Tax=Caldimonas brevitalea TaxID=413882 RepID=A0A0G3BQ28_9BURK|nr:tyrosinase family protein [Caldimonas brevitalea]AKJ29456.1 tyrosinase [Caldimonas brevitalea]
MALGDGIRRDISKVSEAERNLFIDAIVKIDTTKFFSDGISYWDKQEEIHKNAHFSGVDVHAGPAFIPWHRVIVNRLEQLLREVNPALSLHYWDWTTDPRSTDGGRAALFTPQFMGNASGDAGHLLNGFESTEDAETGNGHTHIWRNVGVVGANGDGTPNISSDASILAAGTDFASFASALKSAHDSVAHSYIGGTISNPHYSFHDPFVFLLHSNVDRLWAMWQTDPAHPERLSTASAYAGLNAGELTSLVTEFVEPWAGGSGLEPWASTPSLRAVVTYTDVSVVTPACYDTNSGSFQVLEAENPFNAGTSRFQVTFNDVPEEETTWRAAVVRVRACGEVTLRVKPGTEPAAPFDVATPVVESDPGPVPFREVRVWFQFTAGAVGTAPQTPGPVNTTLVCDENGQEFLFELRANTIHRPTVAVQLALDQSGSMAWAAGTSGATRLQVLVDAASLFANLIQKNNGIGIIRFDQDAYPPDHATFGGMPITKVMNDGFGDPTRATALGVIAAHTANGETSVGDGLEMARNQLNALPAGAYDQKALVVLTDGLENAPKSIAEVAGLIDSRTYAVGLGNEAQVNTSALTALAGSTGGALLLSGLLATSLDDQFRLRKFFLQILAGVTNTSIVRDPTGYVGVGSKVRIPFHLNEADIHARAILLTDFPVVRLSIETPDGTLIDPGNAASFGARFDTAPRLQTSSFGLPLAFQPQVVHGGTWHALLEIDEERYKRLLTGIGSDNSPNFPPGPLQELLAKGAKYCLSVHSFSNLRMNAVLSQDGFAPGARLFLRTTLTEYALPVERRATVRAELEYPDHSQTVLALPEVAPGVFETSLVAHVAGIYRFRVIAEGGSFRGTPFTREQILTAAVWTGGDHPTPPPPRDEPDGRDDWCRLLQCVLGGGALSPELEERLRRQGVDLDAIRRCVKVWCGRGGGTGRA